jgi:opine dehydrogenase
MRITVIGTGNGGQALAGFMSMQGHEVTLYGRNAHLIENLSSKGTIRLQGAIEGEGRIKKYTANIHEAVRGAGIIMIVTTANAHGQIARSVADVLEDNQVIILNPGRTGGALEFKRALDENGCKARVYVAEAQTLVYACRIVEDGVVNIIGVKEKVPLAAVPASDTEYVLEKIRTVYPCFCAAENVLITSLENIGAMFHPCVLLFNAATIERHDVFWFYRDMTPEIAAFIEEFDKERLAVGKAYGVDLLSVNEWISYAYPATEGTTLCEKMRNNPAYYDIKSPSSIFTRQLTEDIPTGVLPIMELGEAAGVEVPLLRSMIDICGRLLRIDFRKDGRTLEHLGLAGKTKDEIIAYLSR